MCLQVMGSQRFFSGFSRGISDKVTIKEFLISLHSWKVKGFVYMKVSKLLL